MGENKDTKSVFQELQADDLDSGITEIESLCFNCGENVSYKNQDLFEPRVMCQLSFCFCFVS